jgi:transposase-like protein
MTATFTDEFKKRIEKIESEAKLVGLNFTSICKEAGISRATPDRWKKKTPKTVAIVAQMEAIVERQKAEAAAAD